MDPGKENGYLAVPLRECPDHCNYQGGCVQGKSARRPRCKCHYGFSGYNCSELDVGLSAGQQNTCWNNCQVGSKKRGWPSLIAQLPNSVQKAKERESSAAAGLVIKRNETQCASVPGRLHLAHQACSVQQAVTLTRLARLGFWVSPATWLHCAVPACLSCCCCYCRVVVCVVVGFATVNQAGGARTAAGPRLMRPTQHCDHCTGCVCMRMTCPGR